MKNFIILLVMVSLLSSCQGVAPAFPEQGGGEVPAVDQTATIEPFTLSPSETSTPAPTFAPTATPSPTPHEMSIEAMRGREYPGSQIVIERELTAAVGYRRYYAYYLSDGLKIYALLTVPRGEKPEDGWPAIVFNHGYIPPEVYQTTERYVAYVDRLARAGYIVFRIDYRGHDQSEGEARGAYSNPGYNIDVLNAVGALKQFPDANPDKIGMWGHSMGGFLTVRSMVISPDIKAGVVWGGVVGSYKEIIYDWRRGAQPISGTPVFRSGWRQDWLVRYGTPDENPEFWNSISATSYLEDLSGPLLLQHGAADKDVPVEFSLSLARRIEDTGGEVEVIVYPDDDHDITRYFSAAMTSSVEFFDRYIK
jgi:dipeptidyl aminopeptidase/acylaminoacyl peptidase